MLRIITDDKMVEVGTNPQGLPTPNPLLKAWWRLLRAVPHRFKQLHKLSMLKVYKHKNSNIKKNNTQTPPTKQKKLHVFFLFGGFFFV